AGTVVASLPATRFAVDPLALLGFHVEVSVIEAVKPEVSLVRSPLGEVYLGNSATIHAAAARPSTVTPGFVATGPDGGFPDLVQALQILDRAVEPAVDAAVRAGFARFSVVDGTINVWDAAHANDRRFTNADVGVTIEPGRLAIKFASSGYGGRWTANFDRSADATGRRTLSGLFSQLSFADLFPALGDTKSTRFATDIPLYGRATIDFARDGSLESAAVRLDLGAGSITFGENRNKIQ